MALSCCDAAKKTKYASAVVIGDNSAYATIVATAKPQRIERGLQRNGNVNAFMRFGRKKTNKLLK
jgi:hypothetical protein